MLNRSFFDQDAIMLAQALLGKVIRVRHKNLWLSAMIIETEAYYKAEKGSHASLGYTEKRKALFMPPGTIYMYYARGGDSLNVSAQGHGNAVLIKAGRVYEQAEHAVRMIAAMQQHNPQKHCQTPRPLHRLCSGQTLVCKALGLKVVDWDQQQFDPQQFFIEDINYQPSTIIQAKRLGIPLGRDEHLPYRFIDYQHASSATKNPLTTRDKDYMLLQKELS